jgi:sulfite exporter TauE/SafE
MMDLLPFYAAITMGFVGSLHCAGMCGPIMLVMPFQRLAGWKKWAGIGLYHFGRISVYAMLGLLLHSFKHLFHPQWQQYVSVALGIALLFTGVYSFLAKGRSVLPGVWQSFVQRQLASLLARPKIGLLMLVGVLNGALPCGLVYMALSLATSAHTPVEAMAVMYVFGMGTMPMLLSIILLKRKIPAFRRLSLTRFVPLIMVVFGSLFVLRGMNLGIPYLSPGVSVVEGGVKSSCCHRK